MNYDIVEGSTGLLRFQLLEDGAPVLLTGFTVSLLLEDRTGTTVPTPGTVTIIDQINGIVQLAPTNANVFISTLGPYFARWEISNGAGGITFVPSGNRDVWNIVGV